MEIELQLNPNPHQLYKAPPKPIFCDLKCMEEPIAYWPKGKIWVCGKHLSLIPSVEDDPCADCL